MLLMTRRAVLRIVELGELRVRLRGRRLVRARTGGDGDERARGDAGGIEKTLSTQSISVTERDVARLSLRRAFVSMTPMRLGAALLSASLVFVAAPSHANGRFPLSQRLFQDKGNPDAFALSATFGLLVSRDHGESWYHVCEGALTAELLESDPLLELMPDGSMLAGLVRPLRRSEDCGCTFEPVLGDAMDQSITDIAKADGTNVLALARTTGPPIVFRIERSTDAGRTWSKLSDLPPRLQAHTLDAAPSNPMRVYVSVVLNADPDAGVAQSTPALLVSDDGGVTFGPPRPIQSATYDDQPYIAAVHPTRADTVYVRTDAWTPNDETGLDEANDALFVTDDAGMQFREVLRHRAKIFGFALSPDAETVLAGFGDPRQPTRDVYPEETGIYSASASELTFTHALNAPVSCLTWNDNGLYACFDDKIGVSASGAIPSAPEGFSTLLEYANVKGPLACNATTCLPEWQVGREDVPAVCERIAAECDVDPSAHVQECSPSGGMGGSGGASTGGSGGASTGGSATGGAMPPAGSGGTSSGGSSAGTSSGAMNGTGGSESDSDDGASSCGCRAPGVPARTGYGAALFALALFALRRRFVTKR
jgi:MYXO-CTERM domain-containing protein